VLARGGVIVFETVSHADMRMRPLNKAFIDFYLSIVGEAALTSAGAYQVEGLAFISSPPFPEITGPFSSADIAGSRGLAT